MTCIAGIDAEADKFELDATLRKLGTGGGGEWPLDIAVEWRTARRPAVAPSGIVRILFVGVEAPPRSFRSILPFGWLLRGERGYA